ncbi:MAG: ATP-binding cassette domain-containing protein [Planctomycetota bacterium]|nr:ATP-binding cassette domain-containing protein [Planctomycetota bacterium]
MIEVASVTKSYAGVPAVDDVTFTVQPGEVVGFLGPNGAGKSTLLKLIATWHGPDSGTVKVAGFDTRAEPLEVRRRLGYLPEHNAQWENMLVDDYLGFIGRVHGLGAARLAERAAWVVERCELGAVLHKRIHQCSKGFRQRIGVAAALIHDPPVLILDEPTHGLDPLQVVAFRDFVREVAKQPGAEKAVLFSSHILAEVTAISDRILMIQAGKLVFDQPTAELVQRAAREGVELEELVLREVRA